MNTKNQHGSKKLFAGGFSPIIVVIILVALGGAVFYFSQKNAAEKQNSGDVVTIKKSEVVIDDRMMDEMGTLTYNFTTQNNSGETGTVTFSEAGEDATKVVIALLGAPKYVSQPAHIHLGTCKTIGTVSHPLKNVVDGKSETILTISYSNLWKEVPFAVNVHKSGTEAKIYTACADIVSDHAMMKDVGARAPSGVKGMINPSTDSGQEKMVTNYMGTILAGKSSPLIDFNKADYDVAIKTNKLVVLYFYANWCPICKEETANALFPAFNELTSDTVIGFRINYKDSDTDKDEENLAREHSIPYQHTKVFVKNGKQILKAPDGWDKARYLTEINKALAQ